MKKLLLSMSLSITALFISAITFGQTNVSSWDTSSPNSCDGGACVTDSINVTEVSIYWTGGGSVLQQGGYCLTGLCAGTYTVTYDFSGTTVTETFIIETTIDPCAGFTVAYTSNEPSNPMFCDGSIAVTANGGTAPYAYLWSTGVTTPGMNDLCAGFYDCYVTDSNGCTSSVFIDLGGMNSNDSILVIDNNTYPDSLVLDTLGNTWLEDCIIDFLSIDFAYVGGIADVYADSIFLNWILVDTNGLVVLDVLVPYVNPNGVAGVYQASLTIFCPQKANGINTMVANDQVYFESMSMGIIEEANDFFTVSNPFNESIQIAFAETGNYTVELRDLNGKIISAANANDTKTLEISTSNLTNGMYLLNVRSEAGILSKKILKL
jgi:hypothetical protein